MSVKRTKSIKIRVTEEEYDELMARRNHGWLASWMREICLGQNHFNDYSPSKTDPDLLRQIARIGNNLNQIARAVNRQYKRKKTINLIWVLGELVSIGTALRELEVKNASEIS